MVDFDSDEALEGVVEDTVPASSWPLAIRPSESIVWTEEQERALDSIEAWRQSGSTFFALTGPAGVGKTTLLREVVERLPHATLTAMTGKAALRLSQLARKEASTLHSALYYPPVLDEKTQYKDLYFTKLRDVPSSLVVVDESSMCTPTIFEDLKRWGCRILFVGDSYQLPPVITGADLKRYGEDYSVFSHVRGAELRTVMRNAGGVLRAATNVRETGDVCRQSDMDSPDEGYEFVTSGDPIARAVDEFCNDPKDHLLITWKNVNRMEANRRIRERLGFGGELPDDGEPVLIKRNGNGFLNGEIVECAGFESGPKVGSLRTLWMKVGGLGFEQKLLVSFEGGSPDRGGEWMDGTMPWITDWKQFHVDLRTKELPEPVPITWGHCLTAHSAQGSEAKRVTVFLNHGDDRNRNFRKMTTLPSGEQTPFSARFLYTATTRGKKRASMIVGR